MLTVPLFVPSAGQVSHLKALEKDNNKLKRKLETYERQYANVEVLKEANRSLENKVKGLDELRQKLAAQALEMDSLKREKNEWYVSIPLVHRYRAQPVLISSFSQRVRSAFVKPEDIDSFSSPRKITKNLAATRIENASLRDRLNTHDLEVRRRDHMIGQLEERARELEIKLDETRKNLKGQEEKGRVDCQQVGLLKQEVAMLKRHLVSSSSPSLCSAREMSSDGK